MTILLTVNKNMCDVGFISVISKVFISIVGSYFVQDMQTSCFPRLNSIKIFLSNLHPLRISQSVSTVRYFCNQANSLPKRGLYLLCRLQAWLSNIILEMFDIQDKSASSFCHQVAAWVSQMFCNCYFVKNHKLAKNSTTPEAKEK